MTTNAAPTGAPAAPATATPNRGPLFAQLAAEAISITGNMMTLVAVPWFVLQTTGSAAKTGLTAFFTTLPVILSASLGGALVERLGYRRASIVADLASGASVVLIPILHLTIGLAFWQLLALVFAGALLDAPGQTARSSLLPDLAARAGMRLERATSAHDGVSRGARMIGGPLAGLLIATLGATNVLFVDAATFAVSALLMRVLVPATKRAPDATHQPYLSALREGLRYIWQDRLVRAIVVMVMVTNMLDLALSSVMLPVYASRVLGSAVDLGLILGAFGVGALIGAVIFGAVGHRLPRRAVYIVAFILAGSPRYFVMAAVPGLVPILATVFVGGLAAGSINPILSTVLYERVPLGMRARVLGAVTAGVWAAMPVGALLAGWLLEMIGLRAALLVAGALYLAATLSPLVSPVWRQMDAPHDTREAVPAAARPS